MSYLMSVAILREASEVISRSASAPLRLKHLAICLLTLAPLAESASAGGLYIQELADSHQGSANAGAQALGTDPSTIFHNPAALSQLPGRQLSLGAGVILGDVKFSPDSGTPVPGGDGGQQAGPAPLLGSYYSHQINDRVTLGAGIFSVSGAALDPNNSWAGRFQLEKIEMLTLTALAGMSYRINEQWSVGASVGVTYGNLDFSLAAPGPLGGEGKIDLDGDDVAPVAILGIHYKPNDRLSFGLAAFSGFDLKFDGDLDVDPPGLSFDSDTELDFAPAVRAGMAYQASEKWTLMGSVGWENWSALDNLYISTESGSAAVPRNWSDTYYASVGFRYQALDDLMLQAGLAYDSNPVDTVDRTADTPIDRQIRLSIGAEYQLKENMKLRGAMTYADYGKGKIRSSTLNGDYSKNDLLFLTVGLQYTF